MELTQAEARLISSMREIDQKNPAGIDGFSELAYLGIFQSMVDSAAAEAARRYQLFLKQAKGGSLIDLKEAQRSKQRHEDTRARAEDKAEYERNFKQWGLPAPEWKTGAPAAPTRSAAAGTEKEGQAPVYFFSCGNAFIDGNIITDFETDAEAAAFAADYEAVCTRINPDGSHVTIYEPGQEKTWPEMSEPEKAEYIAQEWAEAEPGTMYHAAKCLEAPAAAIAAALEVVEAIRQACADEAAAEGLRNDFDYESATDLLTALRLRVNEDRQRQPAAPAQRETDIEIVSGKWEPYQQITVRIGNTTRRRKIYTDHKRGELYITHKAARYYQSDFEAAHP